MVDPASATWARNLSPSKEVLRESKSPRLPDIALDVRGELEGTLDRVGMGHVEVPVLMESETGERVRVPARAHVFVSLDDPQAKGIHMSRLFLTLQETLEREVLSPQIVKEMLEAFVASHREISRSAEIAITLDHMIKRPALKSANEGWRSYPIVFSGRLIDGQPELEMQARITYSSTCPCSAALARQLIQEGFAEKFGRGMVSAEEVYRWLGSTEGISATPHSQRSYADVKIKLSNAEQAPSMEELIDLIEKSLATPVQAAVKREDEQEFARLNARNLMFCEDAARKLKMALNQVTQVCDFWVRVEHVESLHPHDAVAVVTKGIEGGYRP